MEDSVADTLQESAFKPALVEHFSIEGLYKYRTISFSSQHAATVLIAPNGSGKTTLLGALDAFLRGQFSRLFDLEFDKVTCRLRGHPDLLVLSKSDVAQISAVPSDIATFAKSWDITPQSLLEFLENDYAELDNSALHENPVFYAIYTKNGYNIPAARGTCDQLKQALVGRNENVDAIRLAIKSTLGDTDIVYLPTYRRIELALNIEQDARRPSQRKQSVLARLGVTRGGLHAGDMQFGLADISDRLQTLNRLMLVESNAGYGQISANIINDLINGAYEREVPSPEERPSKEALKLFFSRIAEANNRQRFGPSFFQIPDMDRIYGGEQLEEQSSKFLTYFLGKLNTVIKKTHDIEQRVELFIRSCNEYLAREDEMVSQHSPGRASIDDKELIFDRKTLKVRVKSRLTGRRMSLDVLSSGEKQMISLFARLYLYEKQKLVLIDEPELSLSLAWQRKILPDILKAPTCAQVVAITHSPFIFDNALEPYAASIEQVAVIPPGDDLFPPADDTEDWEEGV